MLKAIHIFNLLHPQLHQKLQKSMFLSALTYERKKESQQRTVGFVD